MRRNQRHVLMAALLVSVLTFSGAAAFADGDGSNPLPKPAGVSTYSEVGGVVGMLLSSASYIVDLL